MISLLLILIISIYCTKTVVRNTIWKDEGHFWLNTVQDSPFSVFAHSNLGLVYARKEQYNQAIEEFKKALSLNINPRIANAAQRRSQKSVINNNLGHLYHQALEKSQQASKITSEHADARNNLIAIHGEQGLYQKSLDHYSKALQLDLHNAEAHNNLGDLYYLKKLYHLAEKEYRLSIKFNPYYAEAYNNLGLIYFDEKHYDDAQEEFLKALELKPDFAEAYNNLALVYFNKGLYHKALEKFNQSLEFMPENAEVHFNLALVYLLGFKDKQRGIYYLKKGLSFDSQKSRAAMIREVLSQLDSDKVAEK